MGVPAGEILGWLAEGDIEQVGALSGDHGDDPVFTVAPRLRDALSERLARIGKTAVVLSPLRVRSFLLRSLLHGAHPPLDPGTDLPTATVTSEVPAEALAHHLLTTDLAQVLHEAATDLDADVAAMLQLAQEEAQLELAKTAAASSQPDADPPPLVGAPWTDDEAPVEAEECFDVDDLSELLDDLDGVDDEPRTAPKVPDAAPSDDCPDEAGPAGALAGVAVEASRNEPFPATATPPATDPVQEPTMPSTHDSHSEQALEPVHQDDSVDSLHTAAASEGDTARPADRPVTPVDRAALSEAAAVLEQLLGDEAPSTPLLEPSEIQSALAALDLDEPAFARTESTAAEQPLAPAAAGATGSAPHAEAPPPPADTSGVHAAATGMADAQAEIDDAPAATERTAVASAGRAGDAFDAPIAAAQAEAPAIAIATPSPEPSARHAPERPIQVDAASAPSASGHEVLGAAMQRVDAFLDRLKAALVEMAARPAAPAPASAPAPLPATAPLDVTPLVGAIDGGFAKAIQQSEATAQVLTGLAARIEGLGERLEASTGATVAALQAAPVGPARPAAPPYVMPRSNAVPLVLLAVAGLVTAWSVLFWFKTGSPRLALGTLIGANLVGCCLLAARR